MFFCGLLLFGQEKKIAEYFADSKVWHNIALAFGNEQSRSRKEDIETIAIDK